MNSVIQPSNNWGLTAVCAAEKKVGIKCFLSALRLINLKTWQWTVILDLCLIKPRSGKSHDYRNIIVFKKLSSTPNHKVGVIKFLWFEERFRKFPFSWEMVWRERLTGKIVLAFNCTKWLNSSLLMKSQYLAQICAKIAEFYSRFIISCKRTQGCRKEQKPKWSTGP